MFEIPMNATDNVTYIYSNLKLCITFKELIYLIIVCHVFIYLFYSKRDTGSYISVCLLFG